MTDTPTTPGPQGEELEDTERTVEELTEILMSGGTIEAYPTEELSYHVSIADVDLYVRIPLDQNALKTLRAGLPGGEQHLRLPPMEEATGTGEDIDPGELGLLARALEARASLLGTT